jgi:molybdate transport system ATP-binding protein
MARRRTGRLTIELDGASVRFGRGWALRKVRFRLEPGQRWVLMGANGAGKTLFLKLLRGDVWPTADLGTARRYVLDGEVHVEPVLVKHRIAYLGPERQDKYERYGWNHTVREVVATGLFDTEIPLDAVSRAQAREVRAALESVGLAGLASRRFLTLSYGQRRRVLLARALVSRPDVLLLDEILNGLDAGSRRSMLRILDGLSRRGATWMLTTHRRGDVPATADHYARLEAGRFSIEDSRPARNRRRDRPGAHSRRKPALDGAPILLLRNATVFRDYRHIVGPLDWEIRAGEHWALTGPNGSGKSTLMALLYGDLSPSLGSTCRRSIDGDGSIATWKAQTGWVSPELQALYAATPCTVEELVASGLHSSIGLNEPLSSGERRLARRWIRRTGLEGLEHRGPRELSYGQLRMALLARALVRPRRLLLLDEPLDGLDEAARTRALSLVGEAVADGAALVLATHHRSDLPHFVERELQLRAATRPRTR